MPTNLLTHSNDFSQAVWSKTNTSVATSGDYAPDGTTTLWTITDTNAGVIGDIKQLVPTPAGLTVTSIVTAYCYVRIGTSDRIQMKPYFYGGTSYTGNCTYSLIDGSKLLNDVNGVSHIKQQPNGIWKIWFEFQNNSAGNLSVAWRAYPDIVSGNPSGKNVIICEAGLYIGSAEPPDFTISEAFTNSELSRMDNEAKNAADILARRLRPNLARFKKAKNLILGLGQSLEFSASTTLPPLTVTAITDGLMVGDSVRGDSSTSATFTPIGTSQFNPVVSTGDNNGTILTDYTTAWSTSYSGECPVIAASHAFKKSWNYTHHSDNDTSHKVVSIVTAKSESLLADIALTSGNNYLRAVSAATVMEGLDSDSGIITVAFGHGEADNNAATTQAVYVAGVNSYIDNIYQDIAVEVFGQTERPLWVAHIPSKRWSSDDFYIQHAMLELEATRKDFVIALPSYACQSTDDSANQHLTCNGARFKGVKTAQAMTEVQVENRNFFIPRIHNAYYEDNEVILGFAAMYYPMQVKPVWLKDSFNRAILPGLGFRVTDSTGVLTINSVEVLEKYNSLVKLVFSRSLTSAPTITYAGKTTYDGRGNICDSDPSISPLNYEFHTYAAAGENITALVGKAYDMWNFAAPQKVVSTQL